MDSKQCTELILEAKGERALTFADVAAKVGRSEVWTTSAIFGQARMDPTEARHWWRCWASVPTWPPPSKPIR